MIRLVEEIVGDMGREATISEFEESDDFLYKVYEVILAEGGNIKHKTFFPLNEFGLDMARDWANRWVKGIKYNDNNA